MSPRRKMDLPRRQQAERLARKLRGGKAEGDAVVLEMKWALPEEFRLAHTGRQVTETTATRYSFCYSALVGSRGLLATH